MGRRSSAGPWGPLVLALGCAAAMACEAPREAELLEITTVEPRRLQPGRRLVVEGRGFPPGRTARVRLAGEARRPGRAPIQTSVELEGRALSAERVEAPFTRLALRELGGRGTLHGRVTVIFETRAGEGTVVGRSEELTLDASTASTRGLTAALARTREATAVLDRLGLEVEEEAPEAEGLPVTGVTEGSIAERAGIVPGDRLVDLAGVQLHSLADVVPPPGAEQVTLKIRRRGQAAPFAVRVPVPGARRGMDRATITAAQVALAWLLFVLLLLAPSAALIDAVARRTLPTGQRAPKKRRLRARARAAWRRYRSDVAVGLVGLAVVGAVPAADRALSIELPLEWLALGALAVRVSATWVASAHRSRTRRAIGLAQAFASIAIAALAIGAVAALSGTAHLFAIARAQGAMPTDWTILRTPVGPLALGLLGWAAAHAPVDLARAKGASAALARRLDDVVVLALTLVATSVFLGGWGAAADDPATRLVRAGVFVTMTWVGWLWLRHARRSARWNAFNLVGAGLASVALVGLVAAWIGLEPDPELVAGLAQVVAGGLAVALTLVVYRLASGRLRRAPYPSQPFL